MSRIMTTHDPRITTVQVEIQVLKIGAKQMTLSVFRQLTLEPIFAPDGSWRGTPWGWVNYFWDSCGVVALYADLANKKYLHVVWQDGNTLKRSLCTQDTYIDQWRNPQLISVHARQWHALCDLPQLFIAV